MKIHFNVKIIKCCVCACVYKHDNSCATSYETLF